MDTDQHRMVGNPHDTILVHRKEGWYCREAVAPLGCWWAALAAVGFQPHLSGALMPDLQLCFCEHTRKAVHLLIWSERTLGFLQELRLLQGHRWALLKWLLSHCAKSQEPAEKRWGCVCVCVVGCLLYSCQLLCFRLISVPKVFHTVAPPTYRLSRARVHLMSLGVGSWQWGTRSWALGTL